MTLSINFGENFTPLGVYATILLIKWWYLLHSYYRYFSAYASTFMNFYRLILITFCFSITLLKKTIKTAHIDWTCLICWDIIFRRTAWLLFYLKVRKLKHRILEALARSYSIEADWTPNSLDPEPGSITRY